MLVKPEAIIANTLKPIAKWYRRNDIEEVFINRFEEVVLKMRDGSWQFHQDSEMSRDYLYNRLCRVLANLNRAPIDIQNTDGNVIPIVSCQIPGENFRFQAVLGSKVIYHSTDQEGIALAIRALNTKDLDFSDFGLVEGQDLARGDYEDHHHRFSDDPLLDLIETVKKGKGVLISGATSTGKTSFLKRLLKIIPEDMRILTVEDTHELDVPHRNHIHLLGPRNKGNTGIGYNEILDAVVRLTPDAIINGEISMTNASAFLRMMNTGHANYITTIHADSPRSALRAFVQNILRTGESIDFNLVVEVLCQSIGRIVQLNRADGRRAATDIIIPAEMDRRALREFVQAQPPAGQNPGGPGGHPVGAAA